MRNHPTVFVAGGVDLRVLPGSVAVGWRYTHWANLGRVLGARRRCGRAVSSGQRCDSRAPWTRPTKPHMAKMLSRVMMNRVMSSRKF